jgi:hypothetical protein
MTRPAPTLPALAEEIAKWFPELEGRAVAVAEAEVTPENMPTLPLCMVALAKDTPDHNPRSNRGPTIGDDIVVQFWFKTAKYPLSGGGESPFWAYHDFEEIRDRFIGVIVDWVTPRNFKLQYRGMDVEADQFAVVISFQVRHEFVWCRIEDELSPCEAPAFCEAFKIRTSLDPGGPNS